MYRVASKRTIEEMPESLCPASLPATPLDFLDIHPLELARQLTLIEEDVYLRINARELTELVKSKKKRLFPFYS
jgi:hypothetical protein